MPVAGEIAKNVPLTNFSLKYSNGAMIADQVMPRFSVVKEQATYPVYGRQDQRVQSTKRANGTPGNHGKAFNIDSWATYNCEEEELHDLVTQRDRDNQTAPIDCDLDTTNGLTNQLLLGREKRVADICTAVGNFSTSGNFVSLAGVQQWNDNAFNPTGTPANAIERRIRVGMEKIRKTTGVRPNNIVIPSAVGDVILQDAQIIAKLKETSNSQITDGKFPKTFLGMAVQEAEAIRDSAAFGQSFSGTDLWGKNVFMYHKAPVNSPRTMSFGLTFEAKARLVKKWYDALHEGDWIRVSEILDEVILCEYCGYLIENCIA